MARSRGEVQRHGGLGRHGRHCRRRRGLVGWGEGGRPGRAVGLVRLRGWWRGLTASATCTGSGGEEEIEAGCGLRAGESVLTHRGAPTATNPRDTSTTRLAAGGAAEWQIWTRERERPMGRGVVGGRIGPELPVLVFFRFRFPQVYRVRVCVHECSTVHRTRT